jgi:predicted Zn-dependent peptidase
MERLRRAPVGSEELERVRQYLQGVYMSSFDGAFALADRFRDVHHFGLDSSYYTQYLHTVQHITPEQLQALAQQYLNPADFVTIVAGG